MSATPIHTTVRFVVMAKAPRPGLAKTRLIPALGADGAAALARRLLQHALGEALAAADALGGEVVLCGTPLDAAQPTPASGSLWGLPELDAWLPHLHLQDQGDGALGERMARAVRDPLMAGQPCILLGTDCPTLNRDVLQQVAHALQDHDAALVPATDGGYVALGLRRWVATPFEHMPWSTPQVGALTVQRLTHAGLSLHTCAAHHDIDEPADLQHLPATLQTHAQP